jgi:hypothetical protein
MPQPCTVCQHPERDAIDAALCVGCASVRGLAEQYGLTEASVRRHKDTHLVRTLALARKSPEVARADTLLDQVKDLQARTLAILDAAEEAGERREALAAIREARGNLELLAKLLGEIDERPVVNLVLSPEWLAVRSTILLALTPHPVARLAVADALAGLENGNGAGV